MVLKGSSSHGAHDDHGGLPAHEVHRRIVLLLVHHRGRQGAFLGQLLVERERLYAPGVVDVLERSPPAVQKKGRNCQTALAGDIVRGHFEASHAVARQCLGVGHELRPRRRRRHYVRGREKLLVVEQADRIVAESDPVLHALIAPRRYRPFGQARGVRPEAGQRDQVACRGQLRHDGVVHHQ